MMPPVALALPLVLVLACTPAPPKDGPAETTDTGSTPDISTPHPTDTDTDTDTDLTDLTDTDLTDTDLTSGTSEPGPCPTLAALLHASVSLGPVPLSVTLDATDSCVPEPPAAFSWALGDGSPPATGEVITHTFLAAGEYPVTLTLTDLDGLEDSASLTITVTPAECPGVDEATTTGSLAHDELLEASGLAVSHIVPDLLWTHNDSDPDPRLFAIGVDGRDRGVFRLTGADVGDWEDITLGTDPESELPTLYVGDIGDNLHQRETITVYLVTEPDRLDEPETLEVAWEAITLAYPTEEPLDGDALMFDPQTGDLYIIARTIEETTEVYRKPAPHIHEAHTTLEWVATLPLGAAPFTGSDRATGASMSPLGDRILVRTWDSGFLFLRDAHADLADAFAAPCPVRIPMEPRGEAIDFDADGDGFYTVSEEPYQPVWYTPFTELPPPCEDFEARILMTPPGGPIPLTVTFSADADCVPEGIAEVSWTIDGEETAEEEPTRTWLGSGDVEVTLTIWDEVGERADTSATLSVLPGACPPVSETVGWGEVESGEVNEASGIVHSITTPGVLWTHNDSGDTARLFAMREDGTHLGELFLSDDPSRDWEDLSTGWDETRDEAVLYVGDVGDNPETRDHVEVLIVPEPVVPLDGVPEILEITDWEELELTYPDGESHNCETLMTDPVTGDLYLVTKTYEGTTHVFVKPAPHVGGTSTELTWIADLTFGEDPLPGSIATTGGEFSPLGDRIIIRTYSDAYIFLRDRSASVAAAFAGPFCDARAPTEPQGEAVTFTNDGTGYLTVSEGDHQPILFTPLD